MKFSEMVAAAEAIARTQGARDADRERANEDLARARMAELSAVLAEHAAEIRGLPARLKLEPGTAVIEADRDGRRLRLEVFFETGIWKMYFVSWTVTEASSADDGHGKAASAEETVALLAEMIGRFLGGFRPTAMSV